MGGVVLHIGLHKTATRFLQRAVFRGLDGDRFLVNPEPLTSALRRALRRPAPEHSAAAAEAARSARQEAGGRTLLISEPAMSGDMYSSHCDWRENLALVRELFPEAKIVYFVRRQSDWLQSAHRQSLAKGRGIALSAFLNYRNGAFGERPARYVGGARTVNAFELRFLAIYRGYAEAFGADRVFLFRQQDLKQRPDEVYRRLAEAVGVDEVRLPSGRVSANRGFSALAIHLLFPGLYFPPRGTGKKSGARPLRRVRHRIRRIRTAFIQHVFDRIAYVDWDMLDQGGMREPLERLYERENEILDQVADVVLSQGPSDHALCVAQQDAKPEPECERAR